MAFEDQRVLRRKLEGTKKSVRMLGIEPKLQELQAAVRSANRELRRSPLCRELSILNHKTAELLDQICYDLTKATTLSTIVMKPRFRPKFGLELDKVINEYQETARRAQGEEDGSNLFAGRVTVPGESTGNLTGRDEDVDTILMRMFIPSLAVWELQRFRQAFRARLLNANNDDREKRRLKYEVCVAYGVYKSEFRYLTIMPIVGTAGIGKTAVAQKVFHHAVWFDERIWVHVSPSFDRMRVLRRMAEQVGCRNDQQKRRQSPGDEDENNIMNLLMEQMRNKRFLLVLDDLWNEDERQWDLLTRRLLQLARASQMNGNMVVVTTRSHVASKMNFDRYELEGLSKEDSRRLLSQSLSQKKDKDQLLSSFPEVDDLLERCCGEPAAIHALARRIETSCCTTSREEGAPSPQFRLLSEEDNPQLLDSFRLSYELLFPVHLKNCFLFCSVFPEDHSYDMEEMSDIWVAHRYTTWSELSQTRKVAANLRDCFIPKLELSSSTLGIGGIHKMHPSMYELSRHLRKEVVALESLHLALPIQPGTSAFPSPYDLPKALRTLIILLRQGNHHRSCKISAIPKDSFARLKNLRVLDLQCTMIKELPRGTGKLLHLGYLNLSETDIANLPRDIGKLRSLMFLKLNNCRRLRKLDEAVTNLVNLRKLELSGCCRLVEVPESMENMKRLKCLDIKGCSSLDRMPRGLGKIVYLRRLFRYIVGDTDGRTISELRYLDRLEGELRLDNLEKVRGGDEASHAFLHQKTRLKSLSLAWKWSDDDADKDKDDHKAVLERLRPPRRLTKLEIVSYAGDSYPSWMSRSYLRCLEEIRLFNLKNIQKLPQLYSRIAEISGMDAVTQVDWDFAYDHQEVTFSHMPKLEKWSHGGHASWAPYTLPGLPIRPRRPNPRCLTRLTVINCPRLAAPEMPFPSVKELALCLNNKGLYSFDDSGSFPFPCLEKLSISMCQELSESSRCDYHFSKLGGLRELEISGCPELRGLPRGFSRYRLRSTLQSLAITRCDKLEALPDWLLDFTSLRSLSISGCHSLRTIPDGLRQRPELNIYMSP